MYTYIYIYTDVLYEHTYLSLIHTLQPYSQLEAANTYTYIYSHINTFINTHINTTAELTAGSSK